MTIPPNRIYHVRSKERRAPEIQMPGSAGGAIQDALLPGVRAQLGAEENRIREIGRRPQLSGLVRQAFGGAAQVADLYARARIRRDRAEDDALEAAYLKHMRDGAYDRTTPDGLLVEGTLSRKLEQKDGRWTGPATATKELDVAFDDTDAYRNASEGARKRFAQRRPKLGAAVHGQAEDQQIRLRQAYFASARAKKLAEYDDQLARVSGMDGAKYHRDILAGQLPERIESKAESLRLGAFDAAGVFRPFNAEEWPAMAAILERSIVEEADLNRIARSLDEAARDPRSEDAEKKLGWAESLAAGFVPGSKGEAAARAAVEKGKAQHESALQALDSRDLAQMSEAQSRAYGSMDDEAAFAAALADSDKASSALATPGAKARAATARQRLVSSKERYTGDRLLEALEYAVDDGERDAALKALSAHIKACTDRDVAGDLAARAMRLGRREEGPSQKDVLGAQLLLLAKGGGAEPYTLDQIRSAALDAQGEISATTFDQIMKELLRRSGTGSGSREGTIGILRDLNINGKDELLKGLVGVDGKIDRTQFGSKGDSDIWLKMHSGSMDWAYDFNGDGTIQGGERFTVFQPHRKKIQLTLRALQALQDLQGQYEQIVALTSQPTGGIKSGASVPSPSEWLRMAIMQNPALSEYDQFWIADQAAVLRRQYENYLRDAQYNPLTSHSPKKPEK